jgi:hypothetical protein
MRCFNHTGKIQASDEVRFAAFDFVNTWVSGGDSWRHKNLN